MITAILARCRPQTAKPAPARAEPAQAEAETSALEPVAAAVLPTIGVGFSARSTLLKVFSKGSVFRELLIAGAGFIVGYIGLRTARYVLNRFKARSAAAGSIAAPQEAAAAA